MGTAKAVASQEQPVASFEPSPSIEEHRGPLPTRVAESADPFAENSDPTKALQHQAETGKSDRSEAAKGVKKNGKRRTLFIHLYESDDSERDLRQFQTLLQVLQRHQGPDSIRLTVISGGSAVPLELPAVTVQIGPALVEELSSVVGESALTTEDP